MARATRAEAAAQAADQRAQERGRTDVPARRVARDYVHRVHPDTGLEVVFIPGEALPAWVQVEAN